MMNRERKKMMLSLMEEARDKQAKMEILLRLIKETRDELAMTSKTQITDHLDAIETAIRFILAYLIDREIERNTSIRLS
jgi:hypothetical protein